jgi:general secretion pathway protein L
MHIAAGVRNSNGRIPVVAIAMEQMLQWQQQWQQVSIQPHYLVNEVLSLPWEEGQWSLLVEDNTAMLRSGQYEAFSFPRSQLPRMLQLAYARDGSSIERLVVYDARNEDAALDLPKTVTAELHQHVVNEPLKLLAEGFSGNAINLLQGGFSRREQVEKLWRPWRMTAVLLLAAVVLQIGMQGYRYWDLSNKDEQLYGEIVQVFRDAFPEVSNVVNPKVQMERKLAELQGTGRSGFIELMGKSGPVIASTENVQLQNLRYNRGSLELELLLDNLQRLDTLKSRLQEKGVQVEVISASTGEEQVASRIGLTVAGS